MKLGDKYSGVETQVANNPFGLFCNTPSVLRTEWLPPERQTNQTDVRSNQPSNSMELAYFIAIFSHNMTGFLFIFLFCPLYTVQRSFLVIYSFKWWRRHKMPNLIDMSWDRDCNYKLIHKDLPSWRTWPIIFCNCTVKSDLVLPLDPKCKSCSTLWWYCWNSSAVDKATLNPLLPRKSLTCEYASMFRQSVMMRTDRYPMTTL